MPTGSTIIRSLDAARLDIPLHVPFGISGGAQAVAHNVLVTLVLEDGTIGYGEAAPLPAYNGETQARVLTALKKIGDAVAGCHGSDWRKLAAHARAPAGGSGSAQAGFEMALLDALTKRDGVPLWRFFGGAGTELEIDMTVTTGSAPEAMAAARDIVRRGIRMIKVKIGGPAGAAHDLARLVAIHEVAPEAPLIVDGNAGVSRAEARELIAGLKRLGIAPALLEQWLPKDDLAGMRALHEESGWAVAADEAACTAADVRRIAHERAAQVINIKLMKAGLAEAFDIVAAARETGLGLMIGGNVESMLAMTTSACFAAGIGGFSYADLDTPLFLAENPFLGGFTLAGGRLSVAHIGRGHGVEPRVA
ncbi:MAG: mandelate racemase/muconate lactonizing enzyme family protein [Rariglobus sp.]|jgi:L-alanine-DL-glutamate epimerase-like enolase superfamily enzyme|nr:mandelate racemase/muconate lactonizing enzyme family protein [Rariglobus sp.]